MKILFIVILLIMISGCKVTLVEYHQKPKPAVPASPIDAGFAVNPVEVEIQLDDGSVGKQNIHGCRILPEDNWILLKELAQEALDKRND